MEETVEHSKIFWEKRKEERKLGLRFNNKETVLELNGVEIQAYPSSNIDSFR